MIFGFTDKFFFTAYFKWKDQQDNDNINIGIRRSDTLNKKVASFRLMLQLKYFTEWPYQNIKYKVPLWSFSKNTFLRFSWIWISNQLGVHKLLHFSFIARRLLWAYFIQNDDHYLSSYNVKVFYPYNNIY